MANPHLRPCPTCTRHIRVAEAACPFCGAALSEAFRATAPPQPPRARLSRAALLAFGTGTMVTVQGCTSSPAYGAPALEHDASTIGMVDSGPGEIVDAAYGGPPIDSSMNDSSVADGGHADASDGDLGPPLDAGDDGPVEIVDAAYGGPPIFDAAYGGPPIED